jgi:tRNA (guanine37-N1)-methyltransferase
MPPQSAVAVVAAEAVRDVKDFPYEMFDAVTTHPALSIPAVRTAELRKSLQPLLALRSSAEDNSGSERKNSGSKNNGNRRPAQPYIIHQHEEEEADGGGGGDSSQSGQGRRRSPGRRLLVLRIDYDKNEDDDDAINSQQGWTPRHIQEARTLLAQLLETSKSKLEGNGDAIYLTTYDVRTEYKSMTAAQVLRRLLSHVALTGSSNDDGTTDDNEAKDGIVGDIEVPSRFEVAGHVAHVNLRDEWLPYKHWIGQVLLDKNSPAIKTVVNKVGTIENVYRVLESEIIAGNADPGWSLVTVKEEGCVFDLDFQKVYWNSRLAGEHHRLVKMLKDKAQAQAAIGTDAGPFVVADLMAGVGPFAIPLARESQIRSQQRSNGSASQGPLNIVVHANDLNPDSYRFLVRNAQSNRCQNLHCYNQDARAFVHGVVEGLAPHAVIMNLPASAPEFLDAFRGFKPSNDEPGILPLMYVYCFAPKEEEATGYLSAVERCRAALTCDLHDVAVRTVRNVSPRNNMVCVQFSLPPLVRSLPKILLNDGVSQKLAQLPKSTDEVCGPEPSLKRLKST